jgi:short subunit dehydrogenase
MADRKKRQQPRGDAPRDEERQPSRRAGGSNGSARAASTGDRTGTRRLSPEQRIAQYEKSPYPKQHQPKPGIEAEMEPRPKYIAPRYKAGGKLEGKTALITDEQLERTFRTNIFGYFYLARAALKHLDEGSAIVNTGSITGLEGSKQLVDYSATKGAIHAFTKSEVAPAFVFFASNADSSYITGEVLTLLGGETRAA